MNSTISPAKILIVDDENPWHVIMKTMLPNFDLVHAYSKSEAEEKSKNHTFNLAIIDLCLELDSGEFNGIDLIRQLKNDRHDIPIIAVTQHEDKPELETQSLSAGADRFLLKSQYADGEDWQAIVSSYLEVTI